MAMATSRHGSRRPLHPDACTLPDAACLLLALPPSAGPSGAAGMQVLACSGRDLARICLKVRWCGGCSGYGLACFVRRCPESSLPRRRARCSPGQPVRAMGGALGPLTGRSKRAGPGGPVIVPRATRTSTDGLLRRDPAGLLSPRPARARVPDDEQRRGYLAGWAMVSSTAVEARIRMSFSPGATSTP